ncbi:MAG TPA: hypothetical protein VME41_08720 [Stellaceae bacterium]|nr:hypothetical protein [Stellaceae bacterium]
MPRFWRKQLYLRIGNFCFDASIAATLRTLAAASVFIIAVAYFHSEHAALRLTRGASVATIEAGAARAAPPIPNTRDAARERCGRRGGDWNYGNDTCIVHLPFDASLAAAAGGPVSRKTPAASVAYVRRPANPVRYSGSTASGSAPSECAACGDDAAALQCLNCGTVHPQLRIKTAARACDGCGEPAEILSPACSLILRP